MVIMKKIFVGTGCANATAEPHFYRLFDQHNEGQQEVPR